MGFDSSVAQGEGRRLALVLLFFGGLSVVSAQAGRHHDGIEIQPSESHDAHIGNHGKYFQYGHQDKDHYDMGHRRGNEHHFIEKHEKGVPHEGHASTKVRWGDKHGGYGEHYWDYNHAGHHDAGDGDGTAPVAEYTDANAEAPQKKQQPFQNSGSQLAQTATATATDTRHRQQSRHPSDGFISLPESTFSVNPVKLPKAQVALPSKLNENKGEGRLMTSWSPIPPLHPSPSKNRPLTGHQLSRTRRSLQLPTRIFDRARNSVETRKTA